MYSTRPAPSFQLPAFLRWMWCNPRQAEPNLSPTTWNASNSRLHAKCSTSRIGYLVRKHVASSSPVPLITPSHTLHPLGTRGGGVRRGDGVLSATVSNIRFDFECKEHHMSGKLYIVAKFPAEFLLTRSWPHTPATFHHAFISTLYRHVSGSHDLYFSQYLNYILNYLLHFYTIHEVAVNASSFF